MRVQEAPNDAKAWFLLGRLRAGQGDWKGAHDALLQAYRLNPNDHKAAIFYVETILNNQGQLNVFARQILQKVLTQDPNQADALMLLAADAKQHQCYQLAAQYWQKVLPQVPKEEKMYDALKTAIDEALTQPKQACEIK
jgi:cytochrome c-type biogenesis protein CcmH/NrfG